MLNERNSKLIVRAAALMEIGIGSVILFSLLNPSLSPPSGRLPNVIFFVVITSSISVMIGVGLFNYRRWARKALVFFAGYVLITKLLIFSNLVQFAGNTIGFVSTDAKDIMSFCYHGGILLVFNLKFVRGLLE